jgi:hypothetical protein
VDAAPVQADPRPAGLELAAGAAGMPDREGFAVKRMKATGS